ncbi:hypothetical protein HQQ81_12975 [Microbacteriaceae bacterium VKM Ac-2854]|nr:hypothetical protein [Microbacteriaceae bacterium VKM Ac-2854]
MRMVLLTLGLVLAVGYAEPAGLLAGVAVVGLALAVSAQLRERIGVALRTALPPMRAPERVELPVIITQSRPDAPGRPSPRAPGSFAASR